MKSQQQELSIKTNCKECAFAIYDGKTQTSCAFDRINKFADKAVPAYDEEKEFYVIDTLCCYYRDKTKGYTINDKDKVMEQSCISFDIIIDCNQVSESNRDHIVQFINNFQYHKDKAKLILVHEYDVKETVKDHVEYIARSYKNQNQQINISICANMNEFLNEYMIKTKNLCHFFIKDAVNISKDILLKINNFVNDDLGKFLVIYHNDHLCVSNIAYKIHNMKFETNNYISNISNIIKESKEHKLYVEI